MKILIIQQKRIGDVLLSTILCNNLKKKYPKSTIDFMCYANCTDVLIGNPNIDSVIVLENKVRKSYLSLLKFIFKIRSNKYDILIDVYAKLETNLITIFSGAEYKISYYKWYSSLFYNYNMKRFDESAQTKYGVAIHNRLLLLDPLNLDAAVIDPFPKLYVSKDEDNEAILLLEKHNVPKERKIVMISLLGSEKSKTYPIEYMAQVVDYVAENKDVSILFNYFPNQIEDAQKVFDLCSKNTKEKIHFDVLGSNLRSFIAIMKQCDVIIGNDGGAINMVKALNKPSFIIFSPFVKKNDWATFEDGLRNISVHLEDFKPELINTNLPHKEIKNNSAILYQQFNPELFKSKIAFFMAKNL
jgi:ADP-heptose:LPS heptosyltransferase